MRANGPRLTGKSTNFGGCEALSHPIIDPVGFSTSQNYFEGDVEIKEDFKDRS